MKVGDGEEITYKTATTTVRRAANFFLALQASDGHWPAENAGPLFLHLDPIFLGEYRKEILCFIYCHQNEDGEWGFHVEGHNTMYCTVFNYICMSIIGEGPDGGQGNACLRGQKWILDHGGATSIPSWGVGFRIKKCWKQEPKTIFETAKMSALIE
ncbi:hypothetical protein AAG906_030765 [Vitis piasezkii]